MNKLLFFTLLACLIYETLARCKSYDHDEVYVDSGTLIKIPCPGSNQGYFNAHCGSDGVWDHSSRNQQCAGHTTVNNPQSDYVTYSDSASMPGFVSYSDPAPMSNYDTAPMQGYDTVPMPGYQATTNCNRLSPYMSEDMMGPFLDGRFYPISCPNMARQITATCVKGSWLYDIDSCNRPVKMELHNVFSNLFPNFFNRNPTPFVPPADPQSRTGLDSPRAEATLSDALGNLGDLLNFRPTTKYTGYERQCAFDANFMDANSPQSKGPFTHDYQYQAECKGYEYGRYFFPRCNDGTWEYNVADCHTKYFTSKQFIQPFKNPFQVNVGDSQFPLLLYFVRRMMQM